MGYLLLLLLLTGHQFHCGTERWAVKTLADPEAAQISDTVVDGSIASMRAVTAPTDLHHIPDHRHKPIELTRFRVRALLLAFKQEADEDFHLVLADPNDRSMTMVAEIPSASCMSPEHASVVGLEQSWIISNFGKTPGIGRLKHVDPPAPIVIEGIGFFDFLHGQTGVSPNGIELHPVMSIKKDQ